MIRQRDDRQMGGGGLRVLVTGGAGFVGSHVAEMLIAEGHRVLVVDDLSTGKEANLPGSAELAVLDIRAAGLERVVQRFQPAVVVHAAAQASVPRSVADPANDADVNILGGLAVGRAAVGAWSDHFIYITTGGALYGQPRYLPCDEAHPIEPLSPYGLSKWTLERYLRMLVEPAMPVTVLRLANVYGPRQDPSGEGAVVATFAQRMFGRDPVVIHGDGEQTRDFIYVGDVAHACAKALRARANATLNVGSGEPCSVNALFRTMSSLAGYGDRPVFGPERHGDVRHSCLSPNLAALTIGWRPTTRLEDGLRQTLQWFARYEKQVHLNARASVAR